MTIAYLETGLDWETRISTAGVVTLQGLATIFLVLSVLWLAIEVMHRLIHKNDGEKKVSKKATDTPVAAAPAAVATTIAATASEDEGAIVAAITAAIIAARAEEGCTSAFRVVSFKRAATANARKRF